MTRSLPVFVTLTLLMSGCGVGGVGSEPGLLECATNSLKCGDGIVCPALEACDDGNELDGDYCSADCEENMGFCGDNRLQPNEVCDDGGENVFSYASSSGRCNETCSAYASYCGDGVTDAEFEACDDGNASNTDGCLTNCLFPRICSESYALGDVTEAYYTRVEITQLRDCVSINGDLVIGNSGLSTLEDLHALRSIFGNVLVYGNHSLKNLKGLNSLQSIGGYFTMHKNNSLTNLEGLETLNSTGGLKLWSNRSLESLEGMIALDAIDGNFEIYDNGALQNLEGFGVLNRVGGDLLIWCNDSLAKSEAQRFRDAIGVSNIDGEITIYDNGDSVGCD